MPRPDPDQLLSQLQHAEQRAQRGRLKIFFGACAGVGKTYAMLQAAQQQQRLGVKVLVGVLETHGRADTEQGLLGLPVLAAQQRQHHDKLLAEFDLDAALARRPDLILVDELAHSNLHGSRHPKRWQDVEELLSQGIDVYTSLNVQHLESLNDIVGQVTGIQVKETLPDHVFDQADDVVLVDLPVDELLWRLQVGKVYPPEQARRAQQSFFRKGNLIALRELALRRTADRVDAQMQDYRQTSSIVPLWKTQERLLVLLGYPDAGRAVDAEVLIRHAARLAQQLKAEWRVILLDTPRQQRLADHARRVWLQPLSFAQSLGAVTDLLSSTAAVASVVDYIQRHNISRIIVPTDALQRPVFWSRFSRSLMAALEQDCTALDVIAVNASLSKNTAITQHSNTQTSGGSASSQMPVASPRAGLTQWHAAYWSEDRQGYFWAVFGCTLVTVLLAGLTHWFDLANVVMLYLLVVMWVSARFGRGAGTLAAVLSVLSFDFFFVEPKLSLTVSDAQYLLTFAVMFGVALWVNHLAANLRFQAKVAQQREQRAQQLTELSQQLAGVLTATQVEQIAQDQIGAWVGGAVWIARLDLQDQLELSRPPATVPTTVYDPALAMWAYQHEQPAGQGTDTLPNSPMRYYPLRAPMRTRGVLAFVPSAELHSPDVARLLDSMLSQVALAFERVHFIEVAQQALIKIEGERLRSTLLSALSHDLRTPITVLNSLAQGLARADLSETEHAEMVQSMIMHSQTMQHLVMNLLDMAKLQAGGLNLNQQWIVIDEVVGHVLRSFAKPLAQHQVEVRIDADFPLVYLDELLLARILSNLLENAAKYTPAGSTIIITAKQLDAQQFELHVCDNGAGIPEGMQEQIFQRFARGHSETTQTGLGLGLALCREMMRVQGGGLRAEANQPHGACFILNWSQPMPPAPPVDMA
ncbi:MAG: sensor histidine kinase KdpD [Pseudomonadota bacterium]|nr:sensor histidine kinase KdpD [Pseudomonadota bacterium]